MGAGSSPYCRYIFGVPIAKVVSHRSTKEAGEREKEVEYEPNAKWAQNSRWRPYNHSLLLRNCTLEPFYDRVPDSWRPREFSMALASCSTIGWISCADSRRPTRWAEATYVIGVHHRSSSNRLWSQPASSISKPSYLRPDICMQD